MATGLENGEVFFVNGIPLALAVGTVVAALVGTFIPIEAEPGQAAQDGGGGFGSDPASRGLNSSKNCRKVASPISMEFVMRSISVPSAPRNAHRTKDRRDSKRHSMPFVGTWTVSKRNSR